MKSFCCALLLGLSSSSIALALPVQPGDILVADTDGNDVFGAHGTLWRIGDADPVVVAQGGEWYLTTVAVDPGGQIFTGHAFHDSSGSGIYHINAATGERVLLSSDGLLTDPLNISFDSAGNLIVLDGSESLIRVNRTTGDQSLIASGDLLDNPFGLDVAGDVAYVANLRSNSVTSIDLVTGHQATLSANGLFNQPSGLVYDGDNTLYVSDIDFNADGTGAIIAVDMATGQQTLVASGTLIEPYDLTIDVNGDLLATDWDFISGDDPSNSGVYRITPSTGMITPVSIADGIDIPLGIAVVPVPEPGVALVAALGVILGLHRRR